MILADKITDLRKKSGWSQEELAERLGVSRQAVSKWEGAQSTPDLEKILQMSRFFGVTTDYLIKDELDEPTYTLEDGPKDEPVRRVSMEEANAYLDAKAKTARPTAWAVFLCIISPVCLLLLTAAQESGWLRITGNAAAGIGLCALFILIAVAAVVFIACDQKTRRFAYLEHEAFETEYGVEGMVRQRHERFAGAYLRGNIIGTALCILSVVPIFAALTVTEDNFVMVSMVCILLLMIAFGTVFFVFGGTNENAIKTLLRGGGGYAAKHKENKTTSPLDAIYWPIVAAVYLAYSFITSDWARGWIIWLVAGVAYAAVKAICKAADGKK